MGGEEKRELEHDKDKKKIRLECEYGDLDLQAASSFCVSAEAPGWRINTLSIICNVHACVCVLDY